MTNNSITDIKKCSKCDNKIHARGMCQPHYREYLRNNESPDMLITSHMGIKERLEFCSERVTESGCQIWMRALTHKDYGVITINNKNVRAHRISYETYIGEIPDGMFVCHKCDNPSCINHNHLFLGYVQDNANDMVSKKRQAKGTKVASSKLTDEQVSNIKNDNRSTYKIANDYGVSQTSISKIKLNKRWTHIQ